MEDLQNRIEAVLFASGKGLNEEEIAKYCDAEQKDVKKVLRKLEKEFEDREGSLVVSNHNNKWKLTVRSKYTSYIENIVSETELPGPILKTLAVVAYKSPILQSEIVNMRGQTAYDHIKELVKQKFVTREERGRSFLLKITDKFYNYFDVEGDGEIREVFASMKAEQKKLGDLDVVDASPEKEKKEEKPTVGGLEVVDTNEEELEQQGPITKQRTEEEKKEEEEFLKKIDKGIDDVAKRVDEHKLPERKQEPEKLEGEEEKEEAQTSLEEIEEFVKKENQQKKEDYL